MYGVIDIGSNTIRLSLYEVKDSVIRPMLNKKRVVGLASYIDDNGILTHKGIEKDNKEVITIEALNSAPKALTDVSGKEKWMNLHGDAFWKYLSEHPEIKG